MRNPKIYSDAYQFCVQVFFRTKSFQKALRPTLGRRLEEGAIDLAFDVRGFSVARAYSSQKIASIERASQTLDEIRILLQLAYDMHQLNDAGYGELCELTAEIGKQIGGLVKHIRGKRRGEPVREQTDDGTAPAPSRAI